MTDFSTRNVLLDVSGQPFHLRVLTDLQQFGDPDGHAAALGISSAQWSLFGQVWPAGQRLAEAMRGFDIAGKRILELGCGIGLASLVLQQRGADVVASDIHPQVEPFLAYNAALNALPAVHYRRLGWDEALPTLGHFDVIIASDVLYEREQAERIAAVIERHAQPACEVVVTDPGRGHSARLTARLADSGFELAPGPHAADADAAPGPRIRTLHYRREAA